MIAIYGIKNCDTMKKARGFLDQRGIAYVFHDYKVEGIAKDKLQAWIGKVGWEKLLNRAGTTFKKLPKAVTLMLAQPSMIKRPVLEAGATVLVGFDATAYEGLAGSAGRGQA